MFIIQVIYWVIFMYGLLCLIKDIRSEFTYKVYNKNIKVYVCVKNMEQEYEILKRELLILKREYKNIGINVVDMDKKQQYELPDNDLYENNINIYTRDEFLERVNRV